MAFLIGTQINSAAVATHIAFLIGTQINSAAVATHVAFLTGTQINHLAFATHVAFLNGTRNQLDGGFLPTSGSGTERKTAAFVYYRKHNQIS
jgi:hypothetical protein